jgi:hypothetical protein
MEKEFVPYGQALELKKLGFNDPCMAAYVVGQFYFKGDNVVYSSADIPNVDSPTFAQAFRFFRYNYWYYASISPSVDINNIDYTIEISQFFQEDRYVGVGEHQEYFPRGLEILHTERLDTYEEAELACLKQLIKIANKQ